MGITTVGDGSRALGETSDRFQALANRISEIKEVRRQREIDQHAMGLILQDPDGKGPENAERFLVESMAPQQRGGILGFVDRLVGPGAAPQLSPLQQQVMARRGETALPTPGQQREAAAETRDAEMHPLNKQRIEADTKRLEVAGDRDLIALQQTDDLLSDLLRHGVGLFEDDDIKGLYGMRTKIAKRIAERDQAPAEQTGPPHYEPEPGQLPYPTKTSEPKRPSLATAPLVPERSQPLAEGTVIENKKTGEKKVMRGGKWVPVQ